MNAPGPDSRNTNPLSRLLLAIEPSTNNPRRRFRRTTGIMFIALMALASLWALTTPYAVSPDESAHAIKAAGVVRGQGYGISNDEVPDEFRVTAFIDAYGNDFTPSNIRFFEVPQEYAALNELLHCVAYSPELLQTCEVSDAFDLSDTTFASSTASLYNDTFYYMVGWPSLINEDFGGFFGMRLINALVCSVLLATSFGVLSLLRRPTLPMIGLALVATPATLFLSGTVNPNGLEIAATALFATSLLTALLRDSKGRELGYLMTLAAISGLLQPQIRSLGWVWLGLAVLTLLFYVGPRRFFAVLFRPQALIGAAITLLGIGLAITQILSTSVLTSGIPIAMHGAPFHTGVKLMLERITDNMSTMVTPFEWMFMVPPSYVMFTYFALTAALVVTALVLSERKRIATITFALGSYVFVPAIIQGFAMRSSGYIWQGRYSLAIFLVLLLVAGAALSAHWSKLPQVFATRITLLFVVVFSLMQFTVLYTALHRFAVGASASHATTFLLNPAWLPPFGLGTLVWLLLFGAACALFGVGLMYSLRGASTAQPVTTGNHAAPSDELAGDAGVWTYTDLGDRTDEQIIEEKSADTTGPDQQERVQTTMK